MGHPKRLKHNQMNKMWKGKTTPQWKAPFLKELLKFMYAVILFPSCTTVDTTFAFQQILSLILTPFFTNFNIFHKIFLNVMFLFHFVFYPFCSSSFILKGFRGFSEILLKFFSVWVFSIFLLPHHFFYQFLQKTGTIRNKTTLIVITFHIHTFHGFISVKEFSSFSVSVLCQTPYVILSFLFYFF